MENKLDTALIVFVAALAIPTIITYNVLCYRFVKNVLYDRN